MTLRHGLTDATAPVQREIRQVFNGFSFEPFGIEHDLLELWSTALADLAMPEL